jgi:hypothetical protein
MFRYTAVVALLTLTGCVTSGAQVDSAVGAGQPQEYKQGYAAGCNSGYVAAGHPYYKFTKDVEAYAANGLYKQGWDDGKDVCKSKYESIGTSLR